MTFQAQDHQMKDTIAGGYTQIPQKFYHPNAGRNSLGLVGGNDVTLPSGNLIDVESELRGITRDLSKDPTKNYKPSCPLGEKSTEKSIASIKASCNPWPKSFSFLERGTNKAVTVSMAPRHLPTVQFFTYAGVPAPEPLEMDVYGTPWRF
jgi:hypothetical protein